MIKRESNTLRRTAISATTLLVAAFVVSLTTAYSCQICIPYPTKSAADYLIESEIVVFAREDPDRPFHLAPVETLKGNADGTPIDLFLDSTTRRRLATNKQQSVLLGLTTKGTSEWRRLGYINSHTEPLVRTIIDRSESWQQTPNDRVAFFANYVGHEDHQISTLAHHELARAPYSQIRKHGTVLSSKEIHEFLNNTRYAEWHSLYILLLAQSSQPDDQAVIQYRMHSAAKHSNTLNLTAWATAYIEVDNHEAIAFLTDQYFSRTTRTKKEAVAILAALSVHGNNGTENIRNIVILAYRKALQNYPTLASAIMQDMRKWERNDLSQEVASIVSSNAP